MDSTNDLLRIDDVCLSYGDRHILCHIRETIKKHDFIVLTGPNGGGKTTLLRLIAGLLPPTRGRIVRDEGIITGYLPQHRTIDRQFPVTVGEIVRQGLACRKRWWQHLTPALRAQAAETIESFHLTELADRPISQLSGGQWQRTLLARAFAGHPDLLLLDEPETHLDEASRDELYARLTALRGKVTVVVVSHEEKLFPHIADRRIWHVENTAVTERSEW